MNVYTATCIIDLLWANPDHLEDDKLLPEATIVVKRWYSEELDYDGLSYQARRAASYVDKATAMDRTL